MGRYNVKIRRPERLVKSKHLSCELPRRQPLLIMPSNNGHCRSSSCRHFIFSSTLSFTHMLLLILYSSVNVHGGRVGRSINHSDAFTFEELRETFGVEQLEKLPHHHVTTPLLSRERQHLHVQLPHNDEELSVEASLRATDQEIFTPDAVTVYRYANGSASTLHIEQALPEENCHFRSASLADRFLFAVSVCDDVMRGTIIDKATGDTYVIHPLPERYRGKRVKRDDAEHYVDHVVYKRHSLHERNAKSAETSKEEEEQHFCGVEVQSQERRPRSEGWEDAGINADSVRDLAVIANQLTQESTLDVEVAVFIDQKLYDKYHKLYGGSAQTKLRNYVKTMFNNIQVIYDQESMQPKLTFRVIRYEVLMSTPAALAARKHAYGNAQRYLDTFCRYHSSLSYKNWDHGFLLSGYDLHQGSYSKAISGIARLNGMCDKWNSCTVTEGVDFTSVFIGAHEMGHSLGMSHDEPYCSSRYIMSASLGPGKTTWSSCSMRDYHSFIRRLDRYPSNCLRDTRQSISLAITTNTLPGQTYTADMQCALMHGSSYTKVTPRNDYAEGICYMMWCGQGSFGRIITSHPALEGTICGNGRWCIGGKCVPFGRGATVRRPSSSNDSQQTAVATPNPQLTTHTNGGWSSWSSVSCNECRCSAPFDGAIGVLSVTRTCTNPAPANGGADCHGASTMGVVCDASHCRAEQTIDAYMRSICSNHRSTKRDWELTGDGAQLTRYAERACKVFCTVSNRFSGPLNYRFYGDTLPDGTPCDSGNGQERFCVNGKCLKLSCNGRGLSDDGSCPSNTCSSASGSQVPTTTTTRQTGRWSAWSQWSSCSTTCGEGTKRRARYCTATGACDGDKEERQTCRLQECATPTWSQWSAWSSCSVTCGSGEKQRKRTCTVSGRCNGDDTDTKNCDTGWCAWSSWTDCSVTCGQGSRTRSRTCPSSNCVGSYDESERCYKPDCYEPAEWNSWQSWTKCTVTCGGGVRARYRQCVGHGSCSGDSSQRENCNEERCDNGARWSTWSLWNECSVSCGGGMKARQRVCSREGQCVGGKYDKQPCNEHSCNSSTRQRSDSTDDQYDTWGPWSRCSRTCGGGQRQRFRRCARNAPSTCRDNDRQLEDCNEHSCSTTIGQWSQWSQWSDCSHTCGDGIERRRRVCSANASCVGQPEEERRCYVRACAQWGGWGSWGSCSVACGSGVRRRLRNCYGWGKCPGESEQSVNCVGNRCG